jgi:hypothetical protein
VPSGILHMGSHTSTNTHMNKIGNMPLIFTNIFPSPLACMFAVSLSIRDLLICRHIMAAGGTDVLVQACDSSRSLFGSKLKHIHYK